MNTTINAHFGFHHLLIAYTMVVNLLIGFTYVHRQGSPPIVHILAS